MAAALAALPTPAGAEALPQALLELSEVFPHPASNLTEAEAEWTELLVVRAGSLAGWTLTDLDGAADFTFPAEGAAAGERLLVANGRTPPQGAPAGARVLFAAKDWWTFENGGDEAVLLAPNGTPVSALAWGSGAGRDDLSSLGLPSPGDGRAAIAGASLGWKDGLQAWMPPTPGGANRGLSPAAAVHLSAAAAVGYGALQGVLLCSEHVPLEPFLWTIEWGLKAVRLETSPLPAGGCLLAGGPLGTAWEDRLGSAVGRAIVGDATLDTRTWDHTSPVKVKDPWGSEELSFHPPPASPSGGRGLVLRRACECEGGWDGPEILLPPAGASPRGTADLRVVRAGPALESETLRVIDGASRSLEVNAYLLTATAVRNQLAAAARRGAYVRVLLEASPAGGIGDSNALAPEPLAALNASGVWVRAFNASAPNPARDHAKFIVADGRRVVVSTENFVGAAFSAADANIGYAAVVDSPAVAADMLAIFEWDFGLGSDRTLPRAAPAPQAPADPVGPVGDARATLIASPTARWAAWESAVADANASLWVETLTADRETLGPSSPLGAALLTACMRGVGVRLLVAGSFSGNRTDPTSEAVRALVAGAAGSGCGPRLQARTFSPPEGRSGIMHAKVLVADGARAILGSHNLVSPAMASNREVSLMIEGGAAPAELAAALAADFALGLPLEAAALPLDGALELGGHAVLEGRPAPPPTYAALALAGGATTVVALFGRVRRRTRRRRAGGFRQAGAPIAPALLLPVPADSNERAAPWERRPPADDGPARFSPRVEPPPADAPPPRPPTPPSAFELYESR